MIAMTNREEVAEKLREAGEMLRGSCCSGASVFVMAKDAIGLNEVNNRKTFFDRLADLIDPVCHLVETNDDDGIKYTCSNCGCFHVKDLQLLDGFKYCPVCGSRIERNERVGND